MDPVPCCVCCYRRKGTCLTVRGKHLPREQRVSPRWAGCERSATEVEVLAAGVLATDIVLDQPADGGGGQRAGHDDRDGDQEQHDDDDDRTWHDVIQPRRAAADQLPTGPGPRLD